MRFSALALIAAATLSACAGGEGANDTAAAADTTTATTPSGTPAGTPAGGVATAAPITGTTHEIRMVGDEKGYRFEPANITVKAGDGIRFLMVSGGPHNVAFDPATIPDDQEAQLDANLGTDKTGTLSSAMKMNPGETIMLSLGNVKPGSYPYNCTPHLAMGMTGVITVQ